MAVHREVLVETPVDRFEGMRISWGGIFGGVLAGLGTLMLLSALGLAIGISAVDPNDPDPGSIGTGAAVWTALTLLIALFVGGWASTRLSMLWERTTAMFEGALVWVLSMILILYLTANGIGLVAGGAFSMASTVAGAAGSAVGNVVQDLSSGDVNQILARLNDPQTASQIAAATGVPEQEVRSTLSGIAQKVEAAKDNPAQVAAEIRTGMQPLLERAQQRVAQAAERVQPKASATAWITFIALVLSLLAAIAGAAVGRRNVVKRTAAAAP